MTEVRQVADLAGNDGLPLACPNTTRTQWR